jgi:hypothetical protein
MGPMPLMRWFGQSAIRETIEAMRRVGKLWSRLPIRYRRMVLLCLSILIVVTVRLLLPFSSRQPIDGAVLAAYYPKVLTWLFRKIGDVKDEPARAGLRWAFYPFAAGLILIPVGLFIFPWSAQSGKDLAAAGIIILLFGSCGTFVVIDSIVGASSIFGRTVIVISMAFLIAAIHLFPNIILFLMSNGQWPRPILGGPVTPVWVYDLSVVPPVILILLPTILRELIKWDNAKKATRRLATAWLAGSALTITCIYAILLHFLSGNPLSAMPLTGVALAILFAGVILWPLYKRIAEVFWHTGIAKAVRLEKLREDHQIMWEELRDAARLARRKRKAAPEDASGSEAHPEDPDSCVPRAGKRGVIPGEDSETRSSTAVSRTAIGDTGRPPEQPAVEHERRPEVADPCRGACD